MPKIPTFSPVDAQTIEDAVRGLDDVEHITIAQEAALAATFESAPTLAAMTLALGASSPNAVLDHVFRTLLPMWKRGGISSDELEGHLDAFCDRFPWAAAMEFSERSTAAIETLEEPARSVAECVRDLTLSAFGGREDARSVLLRIVDARDADALHAALVDAAHLPGVKSPSLSIQACESLLQKHPTVASSVGPLLAAYGDDIAMLRQAPALTPPATSEAAKYQVVSLARALQRAAEHGSGPCATKLRELTMGLRRSPLRLVTAFAEAYESDAFVRGAGLALTLLPRDEFAGLEADPRGWRTAVGAALEPHRSALVDLGVWPVVSSRSVGLMAAAGADDARQLRQVLEPVVSGGLPGTPIRGRLTWTERQPILSYAIDARALELPNGLADLTLRAAHTPAHDVGVKWSDWVLEGVLTKVVAADPMGFILLSAPLTESPIVPTEMMVARSTVEEWTSSLTLDICRVTKRDL